MSNYGPPPGSPQDPYGQQPPQQPAGPDDDPDRTRVAPPRNPYGQPPAAPSQPTPPAPPAQPQNPYGQPPAPPTPPAYGQPPAPPTAPQYGQNPYGAQPAYGAAPAFGGAQPPYAHWGQRFVAILVDALIIGVPLGVLYGIGGAIAGASAGTTHVDPDTFQTTTTGGSTAGVVIGIILIVIGWLAGVGLMIWNMWIKQGKTGASIGKGLMKIKVVKEADGQPLGIGLAIGRYFVHALDSLACYIGWLWPLWDQKRQTFADKILSTIVVNDQK